MNGVTKYAPLLHFSRFEQHLPGEPEAFRANAYLHESKYRGNRDRVWNPREGHWRDSDRHDDDCCGPSWESTLDEIETVTRSERPGGPTSDGPVTRPHDDRNLWREENARKGFSLSLKDGHRRSRSGSLADPKCSIYHVLDRGKFDGFDYVALTYWYFFVRNWNVVLTHEGDWEHITLYFRETDFGKAVRPEAVYFAAHNGGHAYWGQDPVLKWEEDSHLHVYVSVWGHASYPELPSFRRWQYSKRWRTWDRDIPGVLSQPWRDFDGAWGRTGKKAWTTGPLGPYFKWPTLSQEGFEMVRKP
jgi:hypothetical protein